jgi:anti-anti-sigma factor
LLACREVWSATSAVDPPGAGRAVPCHTSSISCDSRQRLLCAPQDIVELDLPVVSREVRLPVTDEPRDAREQNVPRIHLEVTTEVTDGTGRVTLRGRLDRLAAPLVEPAVITVLSCGADIVEIDAEGVESADPDGAAALVRGRNRAVQDGAEFRLLRPSEPVERSIAELARRAASAGDGPAPPS